MDHLVEFDLVQVETVGHPLKSMKLQQFQSLFNGSYDAARGAGRACCRPPCHRLASNFCQFSAWNCPQHLVDIHHLCKDQVVQSPFQQLALLFDALGASVMLVFLHKYVFIYPTALPCSPLQQTLRTEIEEQIGSLLRPGLMSLLIDSLCS